MYRTHHLVRILAPLALIGSIAAATPLAQAASSRPTAHLRPYGAGTIRRGAAQAPAWFPPCLLIYGCIVPRGRVAGITFVQLLH
jgi:hypothetical protein